MDKVLLVGIVAGVCALTVGVVIGVIIGIRVGIARRKKIAEAAIGSAEEEAQRLVLEAKKQAETVKKESLLEAK